MEPAIVCDGSVVSVHGDLYLQSMGRLADAVSRAQGGGHGTKITFNVEGVERYSPGAVLAAAALACRLRRDGYETALVLPNDDRRRRVFVNANWATLFAPDAYPQSAYKGHNNVPAQLYNSPKEQYAIVNRMVERVLASADGIAKDDLTAIEWAMNELTDNVLVHSRSPIGGLAQLTNYPTRKRVEIAVVDVGIGIPESLRPRFPGLDDHELIEQATKEGVTTDPSLGQGNGLFGSFSIATNSNGRFEIVSGHGRMTSVDRTLRLKRETSAYPGTVVTAALDFSDPRALANALKFDNAVYVSEGYIDVRYESADHERLVFKMAEETESCGSRLAGTPVRTKLLNVIRNREGRRVTVDMDGIRLVSSSFADEVFGKLFKELGPIGFANALDIKDMDGLVKALVDKAIRQRMATIE